MNTSALPTLLLCIPKTGLFYFASAALCFKGCHVPLLLASCCWPRLSLGMQSRRVECARALLTSCLSLPHAAGRGFLWECKVEELGVQELCSPRAFRCLLPFFAHCILSLGVQSRRICELGGFDSSTLQSSLFYLVEE